MAYYVRPTGVRVQPGDVKSHVDWWPLLDDVIASIRNDARPFCE